MARIGRFVGPDLPHHVTQRGNRRERVFFADADYELYRDLLREACAREGVAVWSYCLMPNHAHLILTPKAPEGLGWSSLQSLLKLLLDKLKLEPALSRAMHETGNTPQPGTT
jgi:REP element-mobilizing transposase RayT